jgi:RNA polymerase-binding transcription factor DksA
MEPLADGVEDEGDVAGDEVAGDEVTAAASGPRAEREVVLDRIQGDLEGVETALERLDDGSYGTCQACGSALDDELLADDPTLRFCAEHQPA